MTSHPPALSSLSHLLCPPSETSVTTFEGDGQVNIDFPFIDRTALSGLWLQNPDGPNSIAVFRLLALPSMERITLRNVDEPEGCQTCDLSVGALGVFAIDENTAPVQGVRLQILKAWGDTVGLHHIGFYAKGNF